MRQQNVLSVLVAGALLGGCSVGTELPRRAAREFSADSARQYVGFLASDELQGRATPSPGLLQAAAYIADAFRRWKLEPLGDGYWHTYRLIRRDLRRESLLLRFRLGDTLWEARIPEQAVPVPVTGAGAFQDASLVLLGPLPADTTALQAAAPMLQHSVVLLVRSRDGADTAGGKRSRQMSLREWLGWMKHRGVVGMLLAEHPKKQRTLRPQRFPWPAFQQQGTLQALPLQLPEAADTVMPVVYSIGGEVLEKLFGTLEAFRQRLEQLGSRTEPHPEPISGVRVDLSVAFYEREHVEVPNVVGILRGQSRAQEYVLIGAHYDHVGVMSVPGEADSIYNGADDNASGTAGLMLIARALAQLPEKPARSVVFVAFSGEEKGLLGSRAFVRTPPLPLEKCVAMLNLDMIGRNHPDSLSVGCREQWLRGLLEQQNRALSRPFLLGEEAEEFFGRSDHASFAARGIPVLFFFTGLHEDYHRPSDHADKLNYDKLSRVALLAARVAWAIANSASIPPQGQ